MARKRKIHQLLEETLDDICKKVGNEYSIGAMLINRKRGEVCYLQSPEEEPFFHLAALLTSGNSDQVFREVVSQVSEEAIDMMRRVLEEYDKPEAMRPRQCYTCRRFVERSHHFGTCCFSEGVFDGEEYVTCKEYRHDNTCR